MTIRTSKRTVTFRRPFILDGFGEELPAGAYDVETDEELLEDMSFPAYRRILTVIHLHARADRPGYTQSLTIDPNELDAALERDQAPKDAPVGRDAHQETLITATKPRQEKTDRLAVDRAENEGMIVHPEQTIAPQHELEVVPWAFGHSAPCDDTERGLKRLQESGIPMPSQNANGNQNDLWGDGFKPGADFEKFVRNWTARYPVQVDQLQWKHAPKDLQSDDQTTTTNRGALPFGRKRRGRQNSRQSCARTKQYPVQSLSQGGGDPWRGGRESHRYLRKILQPGPHFRGVLWVHTDDAGL